MSKAKQPYRLSEERIAIERIARDRYQLRFRNQLMTVNAQALLDLMDYSLLHAKLLRVEALSREEPDDVQEQLQELDRLELAADIAEELMIQTNDEGEAFRQWKALKANQSAQQDIKTALESQGYRITLDLEPHAPSRYSVSHPSRKDRDG